LELDRTSTKLEDNVGGSPAKSGEHMLPAIEVSFALWGMIVCGAIEADQVLLSLF